MRMWVFLIVLGLTLWASPSLGQPLTNSEATEKRFNQGLALYFHADFSEAIRAFEEAIQLNPKAAKAYYFLGYAYYQTRDLQRAREAFLETYHLNADYNPRRRGSGSHESLRP